MCFLTQVRDTCRALLAVTFTPPPILRHKPLAVAHESDEGPMPTYRPRANVANPLLDPKSCPLPFFPPRIFVRRPRPLSKALLSTSRPSCRMERTLAYHNISTPATLAKTWFPVSLLDQFEGLKLTFMSVHVPPIEEMWADDSRPFCEVRVVFISFFAAHRTPSQMVEDAPSSTTLKLLPLPDTNAPSCTVYPSSFETRGDNASFPSKPATFNAINERELPPIHWSSSSLAGALGPLNTVTSEPSTAPENPLPEGSSLTCEVDVPTETQERESHAVIASFPEAIFPRFNWNDLLEEVTPSSISSMLEEAGTYEQQSLQQLLDLLDSPSYVGPAF